MITHSGFVAIVGRPNVGKSTLLNHLIGSKISITSPKPQTTRFQILGIKTIDETQIIFIDTPGMHRLQKKAINRYMNRVARAVIADADVILFIIEATHWQEEDEAILKVIKQSNKPVILVLNKIDLVKDKSKMLPMIAQRHEQFDFAHIVPISAIKNNGLTELETALVSMMPEGPAFYPEDQLTDKDVRFRIAEIIREKIIYATEQELPYATAVTIEEFEQQDNLVRIGVIIWVEREGQKVILIGKDGIRLKKIGTAARKDIEKLLGNKVFLRLWVKIKTHWADSEKALHSLGYE